MGWLSSFFSSSPSSSTYSRNGQTLSSTHEAFSLPTSSPTLSPHPDAFSPTTPDLDPNTPNYTYPPQGSAGYGYVRTSSGLNSRPNSASLLPIHHTPRSPLPARYSYPPLSTTWDRIRTWLNREYPELGDTLNYGILPQDLEQIELQFGFALPPVLRESYLCVDGQEAESAAGCSEGLFFGLKLLPLEDVLEEWKFWREVDDDPTTGANPHLREAMQSIPPGWVRKDYSQRGWIPLIADKAGNYVGVDLNPDDKGSVGQVIVFGRDFDTKVVLWRGDGLTGWAKWLAGFADDLESGEGIDIGTANDGSDDSEDDVGYESYFYDGTGRGQGDGGGDTGTGGGLRMTGEYRGWNVFEAWADRSVRRWHEAGVISSLLPSSNDDVKSSAAKLERDSSTSIGIPFLADDDDDEPVLAVVETTAPRDVPTISVTKAPAPKPVDLPLPDDIIPVADSPPSSSFDEDLESGRGTGVREVFYESPTFITSGPSKSLPSPTTTEVGSSVTIGSSLKAINTRSRSASNVSLVGAGLAQVPDLMADSVPAMHTKPIAPSSPAPPQAELAESSDAKPDPTEGTAAPIPEPEPEPAITVRLVGGGAATANTVSDCAQVTEEPEVVRLQNEKAKDVDSDVASVTSAASESTPAPTKHKKTLSGLAGLKKLGSIPGMRKRDSGSSVKGAT